MTLVMAVFIGALLVAAAVNAIKFCVAWYFAFHFAKRYKRLPAHLRPPGWPPTRKSGLAPHARPEGKARP